MSTYTSLPLGLPREMVGGHCDDATTFTGAFMYLHVLEESGS